MVIGFSLETENEIENSKKKLKEKNIDYIVINKANEERAGFDSDTNRVIIVSRDGEAKEFLRDFKASIATNIWGYILEHGRQ